MGFKAGTPLGCPEPYSTVWLLVLVGAVVPSGVHCWVDAQSCTLVGLGYSKECRPSPCWAAAV
eukprot:2962802-Rhodomonas_salina.1